LKAFGVPQFAALCIVSEVELEEGSAKTTVTAGKSSHPKCQRCWNYWPSVGASAEHPDICDRCATVVHA